MRIKETTNKNYNTNLKENNPKNLDISFTKIIDDYKFGLPTSSSDNINDKSKVQKIVKTLMYIRERKNPTSLSKPKKNNLSVVAKNATLINGNGVMIKLSIFLPNKTHKFL